MHATLVLSPEFTSADIAFLKSAMLQLDREFTITVTQNTEREALKSIAIDLDIVTLLTNIEGNPDKFKGIVTDELGLESGELSINLVDQVRYNGVDFEVLHNGDVINDDDFSWTDAWTDQLCGDMLPRLNGIVLLMMFGTKIDEKICQSLVDCDVTIEGLTLESQQRIFGDYDAFVVDLLNGIDTSEIDYDVREGYDS